MNNLQKTLAVSGLAALSAAGYFVGLNDGRSQILAQTADARSVYSHEIDKFKSLVGELRGVELSIATAYKLKETDLLVSTALALAGSENGAGGLVAMLKKIPSSTVDKRFIELNKLLFQVRNYDLPEQIKNRLITDNLLLGGL